MTRQIEVILPEPHGPQGEVIDCDAPRIVWRAGRRGGKTVGAGIKAVRLFLSGRRVLYAVPTSAQMERFWHVVTAALAPAIYSPDNKTGVFYKNETSSFIELPGTDQRIKAKTAWNADTLRGDYADFLILDEFQLMNEDAWELVGAPMMLDTNGSALFIYTPPSIYTAGTSKARDKMHAAKLFKRAMADTSGRWRTFHFSSHDNPYLSKIALAEIAGDMSALAYQQEILALDIEEVPGALWKWKTIDDYRIRDPQAVPTLTRIVVGVDPPANADKGSAACGIVVAGKDENDHGYVLEDCTMHGEPDEWADVAIDAYHRWKANNITVEVNNGGDMVEYVFRTRDKTPPLKTVWASRGKMIRAEPVSSLYSQGKVHHVGRLEDLEDQMTSWLPGAPSPDTLDAMVWAMTDLLLPEAMTQAQVIRNAADLYGSRQKVVVPGANGNGRRRTDGRVNTLYGSRRNGRH